MGFDEEWAQLRSEAAARQSSGTRLNQLAPAGGGGGGGEADFGSDPKKKGTASNQLSGEVTTLTKNAAKKADEATGSAVTAFSGWETAVGLKKVEKTWDSQVKMLLGRLSREATSLGETRRMFQNNDFGLYNDFHVLKKPSPEPGR